MRVLGELVYHKKNISLPHSLFDNRKQLEQLIKFLFLHLYVCFYFLLFMHLEQRPDMVGT